MKKSLGAKTLLNPLPVWVVGTYDKSEKPNIMTASWAGICCSKPPCAYVSLRKATYTYGNIVENKAFTINVPSKEYIKQVDLIGMISGKEHDKFSELGFTVEKSDIVNAPYVKEFPLIIECKLLQTVEIGLHTEFIGEIMDVKAEESVINENSLPDIERISPIIFSPEARKYYSIGEYLADAFSVGKK